MGIKFLCPNGHKLNVKSYLSGKKAICPKCGARVLVPADSTLPADSNLPAEPGDSQDLAALTAVSDESSQPPRESMAAAPIARLSGTAADPLDETPEAVWYVRPASGGQFGPASGEIMRGWLTQGRVGASSLVWRAGWSEWRSAAAVFPELAASLASPEVVGAASATPRVGQENAGSPSLSGPLASGAGGLAEGQTVQTVSAGAPVAPTRPNMPLLVPDSMVVTPARRRRRRNDKSIMASAVLAIVIVVLLTVLILIARRSGPSEPTTTTTTDPTDLSPLER